MKITVVGAGAVGGYFGGRMQQAGFDVTFLVRQKRADQLKQTGLVIHSPLGDAQLAANVETDPTAIAECDLVLLGVKNYHLPSVMESIKPLAAKGAKILPLLNGVEHFSLLETQFGREAILGGLCQIIATLNEEGHILHTSQMHSLSFGPLIEEQQDFCREFYDRASLANMQLNLSKHVLTEIWGKYAFITAFSGVTTASRLTIDQVIAMDATREVYRAVLAEMYELAKANGVHLPEAFVEATVERMKTLEAGSTSSMHQDFRKGLPLEVESLQGAAVRLASQAGVQVPTVKTLYGLIKPYENQ